jgi:hypothetical protein
MIAQRLIEDARAAGLSMEVEGGDLIVEADRDPPPELLAELRQHKAELIAFLIPPVPAAALPYPESDDLAERAALVEYGAGVPRAWAEGFVALVSMPAPNGFSPERWQRIIDAAGVFIDKWAARAIACGWSDLDVFGANPDRPDALARLGVPRSEMAVSGRGTDSPRIPTAPGVREPQDRRVEIVS